MTERQRIFYKCACVLYYLYIILYIYVTLHISLYYRSLRKSFGILAGIRYRSSEIIDTSRNSLVRLMAERCTPPHYILTINAPVILKLVFPRLRDLRNPEHWIQERETRMATLIK